MCQTVGIIIIFQVKGEKLKINEETTSIVDVYKSDKCWQVTFKDYNPVDVLYIFIEFSRLEFRESFK